MSKLKLKYNGEIIEGFWNDKIYFANDKNFRKFYVDEKLILFQSVFIEDIKLELFKNSSDYKLYEEAGLYDKIQTFDLDSFIDYLLKELMRNNEKEKKLKELEMLNKKGKDAIEKKSKETLKKLSKLIKGNDEEE